MRNKRADRNGLTLSLGLALLGLMLLPPAMLGEERNPVVMPPHSVVAGKTLQEWSALWWKWAYAIPATDNPLLDDNGDKSKFGDVGPVFFLAGWFFQPPQPTVHRSVTIPADKFIFFPIVNAVVDNVGNGCTAPTTTPCPGRLTIDQLFTQLAGFFSPNPAALTATVDDKQIPNLWEHRETAPAFSYTFQITDSLSEKSFGYAGPDAVGTVFPAVADGYYLMLRPLHPRHHTISFGDGHFLIIYNVAVTAAESRQPAVLIP
ncbi:MAG: hypothetical protein WBW33_25000 [Bryobacteraceae bacterium]